MILLSPDILSFIAMTYFIGMAIHTQREFIKTRGLKGNRFCDNRANCWREWVLRGMRERQKD